jgi:hypothetical protein
MDRVFLGVFALLSFYVGFVYLFNQAQALRWDNSQRQLRGLSEVRQDATWEARARRRGISAFFLGAFLLAIVLGVL